jgi:hypothetical protein
MKINTSVQIQQINRRETENKHMAHITYFNVSDQSKKSLGSCTNCSCLK